MGSGGSNDESTGDPLRDAIIAQGPRPERSFVEDETVESLASKLVGLTDAQAQVLMEPYVGKWLRVSGIVVNATRNEPPFDTLVSLYCADPQRMMALFFPREDPRPLELSKNDGLFAQGQIMKVASSGGVALEHCEILRVIPKAELEADAETAPQEEPHEPEAPDPKRTRPIGTGEMRKFAKLYLEIWGAGAKEIPAWQAMKACYPDGIIGRDPFLKEFRELRGPGRRGNPAIRGQ